MFEISWQDHIIDSCALCSLTNFFRKPVMRIRSWFQAVLNHWRSQKFILIDEGGGA